MVHQFAHDSPSESVLLQPNQAHESALIVSRTLWRSAASFWKITLLLWSKKTPTSQMPYKLMKSVQLLTRKHQIMLQTMPLQLCCTMQTPNRWNTLFYNWKEKSQFRKRCDALSSASIQISSISWIPSRYLIGITNLIWISLSFTKH